MSIGYSRKFIFRGDKITDHLITNKVHANTIPLYDGIDLDISTSYASAFDFTVLAPSLNISFDLSNVSSLNVGITTYTELNGKFDKILEPYIGIHTEYVGINANLIYTYLYNDVTENDGTYIALYAAKTLELSRGITVDTSMAYNNYLGFNNINTMIELPIAVGGATITPYIAYSISTGGNEGDDELDYGVTLKVGF